MGQMADFDETELWVIRSAVTERYGKTVDIQLADSELRLDPDSHALTTCPTVFWTERGANFVICKVGKDQYRSQFFYGIREQFGTARQIYDNLAECVTILLQVQADHERDRRLESDAGLSKAE